MFDLELQMRFIRSSTDAFIEFGKAAMAATEAWQREVSNTSSSPNAIPAAAGFEMWTQAWTWWMGSVNQPVPDFWRNSGGTNTAGLMAWSPMTWPWLFTPYANNAASMYTSPFGASPFGTSPFGVFDSPMMRMMPWSFYQGPLMGMMLSAGMPYTVAAPAARASTSAMDAADAAQQQFKLMFSAYRNDSGYATATI